MDRVSKLLVFHPPKSVKGLSSAQHRSCVRASHPAVTGLNLALVKIEHHKKYFFSDYWVLR